MGKQVLVMHLTVLDQVVEHSTAAAAMVARQREQALTVVSTGVKGRRSQTAEGMITRRALPAETVVLWEAVRLVPLITMVSATMVTVTYTVAALVFRRTVGRAGESVVAGHKACIQSMGRATKGSSVGSMQAAHHQAPQAAGATGLHR